VLGVGRHQPLLHREDEVVSGVERGTDGFVLKTNRGSIESSATRNSRDVEAISRAKSARPAMASGRQT